MLNVSGRLDAQRVVPGVAKADAKDEGNKSIRQKAWAQFSTG
jgi:hypothetical protein